MLHAAIIDAQPGWRAVVTKRTGPVNERGEQQVTFYVVPIVKWGVPYYLGSSFGWGTLTPLYADGTNITSDHDAIGRSDPHVCSPDEDPELVVAKMSGRAHGEVFRHREKLSSSRSGTIR